MCVNCDRLETFLGSISCLCFWHCYDRNLIDWLFSTSVMYLFYICICVVVLLPALWGYPSPSWLNKGLIKTLRGIKGPGGLTQAAYVQDLCHQGLLSPFPAHRSHTGTRLCAAERRTPDVIVQMCGRHGLALLSAHWLQPLNPLCISLLLRSALLFVYKHSQSCRGTTNTKN